MGAVSQIIRLAGKDYRHEKLLSLCSILSLAAVLTPLLILYGVKFGVIHTMTERMRSNPSILEVSPMAGGSYEESFFDSMRANPSVDFIVPRTRSIAATANLASIEAPGRDRKVALGVSMEPTGARDPLLLRYGIPVPSDAVRRPGEPEVEATPVQEPSEKPAADMRSGIHWGEAWAATLKDNAKSKDKQKVGLHRTSDKASSPQATSSRPSPARPASARTTSRTSPKPASTEKARPETAKSTDADRPAATAAVVAGGAALAATAVTQTSAAEEAGRSEDNPLGLMPEGTASTPSTASTSSTDAATPASAETAASSHPTSAPAPSATTDSSATAESSALAAREQGLPSQAEASQVVLPVQDKTPAELPASDAQKADASQPTPPRSATSQTAETQKSDAPAPPRRGSRLSVDPASLHSVQCVLSEPTARTLGVSQGEDIVATFERSHAGRIEKARVLLQVTGVLPPAAQELPCIYVPLKLLMATEDFRDGRAVPELGEENGWRGEKRPDETRVYAGYRLYAKDLDGVSALRRDLIALGQETHTHADEIEQMRSLETGLNLIFTLICAAAALGFLTSTASNVLAGIKRKERTLGLLQVGGFTTATIALFPLVQVTTTAILGTGVAVGIYFGISLVINQLFASSLQGAESICLLQQHHYLVAFGASILLSLVAALGPAVRGASVDASAVIRDV